MSSNDLRAVLHTVTIGALIDWAGETADMDDCREAGEAVADTLSLLDWRTILAEHPTPAPSSGLTESTAPTLQNPSAPSSDVTREELADWMRGEFPHYGLTKVRIFDKVDQAEVIDALLARYQITRRAS